MTLRAWGARLLALGLLASLVPPALSLAQRLRPAPGLPAGATRVADTAADQPSYLGLILDAAPFGRAEAAAPAPAPALAGLVLLGVTVAASPGASRAMIAGGSRGAAASYGPGDKLAEGVTLAAVAADGVTLEVAGRAERLGFPGPLPEAATAGQGALIDFSGSTGTPLP